MTKFAQSRFSVGVGSKDYRDNFDRIFRPDAPVVKCDGWADGVARGACSNAAEVTCDGCGAHRCDNHGCACPAIT